MGLNQIVLNANMLDYLQTNTWRETEVLAQLRQETSKLPVGNMISAPEVGQWLALLIKLMQARKVIEVGTFTGYASLWMAQALPDDGQLICCDVSDEWTALAKKYWRLAGVDHKIECRIAPAAQTLSELACSQQNTFDFIFIDADKAQYHEYYEFALTLLKPGGLIVLDNVLLEGQVADESVTKTKVQKMRALNKKIQHDTRVDMCCLPLRDGFSLVLKR